MKFYLIICKAIILAGLLFAQQAMAQQFGYVDKLATSYQQVDTVYINTYVHPVANYIYLYNINQVKVDSALVINHTQDTTRVDTLDLDFHFLPTAVYHCNIKKSGLYYWENNVMMIIKSITPKKLTVVYPSNTTSAYNDEGGRSFYTNPMIHYLSFHRGQSMDGFSTDFFKWMLNSKFDSITNYVIDSDLDSLNHFINSDLLVIPGHSEYWSRAARVNFDAFVNAGKNVAVLSGNTMWWQIRYLDDYKTLVCYKSTADTITDKSLATINWYLPSLAYPIQNSIGADYLSGYISNYPLAGFDGFKIIDTCSAIFNQVDLHTNNVIHVETHEFDGMQISLVNGIPHHNNNYQQHYLEELLGYDIGTNCGKTTYPTFQIFQHEKTSGKMVQLGTTNWCGKYGMGGTDSVRIKQITQNIFDGLLSQNIFCKPNSFYSYNAMACLNSGYYFHHKTIKKSGIYYDSLINSFGGDSIVELHLSFYHSMPFQVNACGNKLTVTAQNATFQWIDGNTLQPFIGETDSVFEPAPNTKCAVIIKFNNQPCTDTSATYSLLLGTSSIDCKQAISLYPNPAHTNLFINTAQKISRIDVYDEIGKLLYIPIQISFEQAILNIQSLPKGIYFLITTESNGNMLQNRFIKE